MIPVMKWTIIFDIIRLPHNLLYVGIISELNAAFNVLPIGILFCDICPSTSSFQ